MKELDYLFLDYVSDLRFRMELLFSDNVDEIFNKPHHRLTSSSVLEELQSLYKKGLIIFSELYGKALPEPVHLDSIDFKYVYVGLSSKGGALWENFFQADWNKYYSEEIEPRQGFDLLTFGAGSVGITEKAQQFAEEVIGCKIILPVKKITFWKPVYWKELSEGYVFAGIHSHLFDLPRNFIDDEYFKTLRRTWRRFLEWDKSSGQLKLKE